METVLRRKGVSYAGEGKDFWRQHLLAFKESGLKKASYCRGSGINYYRFNYWEKVLSDKGSTPVSDKKSSVQKLSSLLPVEIKGDAVGRSENVVCLCSVEFKNGTVLRIHDEGVVGLIVGRLS
jgi:hypothetical protein